MGKSFGDAYNTTNHSFIIDENGDYYEPADVQPHFRSDGTLYSVTRAHAGTPIYHLDSSDLTTAGTHNVHFVLDNGNYFDLAITVMTYMDPQTGDDVFGGVTYDIRCYNEDGTSAGVSGNGSHYTGSLTPGQYEAWLDMGATVYFSTSLSYDEVHPATDGSPYYNFGYGLALIPDYYTQSFPSYFPIGGIPTAGKSGSEIDYVDMAFERCILESNTGNETVNATNYMAWIEGSYISEDEPEPGEDTDGEDNIPGGGISTGYIKDDGGIPSLPTLNAAKTGLFLLYHVTQAQLASFSHYLWSAAPIDNIRKNFTSPAENIIMVGIVPWSNFNESASHIYIGNIDTELPALKLNESVYELDCGSISVGQPTGTFADYEPYTEYWIYLPYIGMVPLSPDDVALGGQVNVIYHFDVFSGACVAFVRCFTAEKGWFTIAEYSGNLLSTFPIGGANYMTMYNQLAQSTVGAIGAAATQNYIGAAGQIISGALNARPTYSRSGSISNVSGMLGNQVPILIRSIPKIFNGSRFQRQYGFASEVYGKISSRSGFLRTRINFTDLTGIALATDEELNEIQQLLAEGIYV